MPQLCLAVASLALSTSRPVCVVLLANRLSLVLPYLKWYHTLLSSAVVSNTDSPNPCSESRKVQKTANDESNKATIKPIGEAFWAPVWACEPLRNASPSQSWPLCTVPVLFPAVWAHTSVCQPASKWGP